MNMMESAGPARIFGLLVYIGVVSYSGLLAFYYLFVNPPTRLIAARLPSNRGIASQSPGR
jgi:hypothetical protein